MAPASPHASQVVCRGPAAVRNPSAGPRVVGYCFFFGVRALSCRGGRAQGHAAPRPARAEMRGALSGARSGRAPAAGGACCRPTDDEQRHPCAGPPPRAAAGARSDAWCALNTVRSSRAPAGCGRSRHRHRRRRTRRRSRAAAQTAGAHGGRHGRRCERATRDEFNKATHVLAADDLYDTTRGEARAGDRDTWWSGRTDARTTARSAREGAFLRPLVV